MILPFAIIIKILFGESKKILLGGSLRGAPSHVANVIMGKSYTILCLSDMLKRGEILCLEEICDRYSVSVPTFRRYVALLRDYFWQEFSTEIVFVHDDVKGVSGYKLREPIGYDKPKETEEP